MRRVVVVAALVLGCTGNPKEGEAGDGDGGSTASETGTTNGPSTTTGSGVTSMDMTSATSTTSAETQGVDATSTDTSGSPTSGVDTSTQTTTATTSDGSTTSGGESSTGTMVITCDELDLPDMPPTECSIDSNTEADLTVINACETESIEVYWVDYGCNESLYQVISPGNDWGITSYETHPWRIRSNADLRLMAEIPALTGNTTVEVP